MTNYYLCCGRKTGVRNPEEWVGIDIMPPCDRLQDVRTIQRLEDATFVIATPPCDGFTDLPWRPATGEGADVLLACLRLCKESGAPWILENSRFAQKIIGPAIAHRGPHYFWGDFGLLALFEHYKGGTTGKDPLRRAAMPSGVLP